MKSGTSTASTKTVFVSRTQMILISPDSLDIRIFSGFGVSHFALSCRQLHARRAIGEGNLYRVRTAKPEILFENDLRAQLYTRF